MQFAPRAVAQPLAPAAQRKTPIVVAHLLAAVFGFHQRVLKDLARIDRFSSPNQRLGRVRESHAAEIGHRIRLAPNHIVQNPVAQILHQPPNAENVVIRADDPNRPVRAQHAAAFAQPLFAKIVVLLERFEFVPLVVDAVDARHVRAQQFVSQLQIVWRIGENQIDRFGRQPRQHRKAIARRNRPFRAADRAIERRRASERVRRGRGLPLHRFRHGVNNKNSKNATPKSNENA